MRWPLTIITDKTVPYNAAACVRGPFILIRPQYQDDYGLYKHELVHIKQTFKGLLVIHGLAYRFLDSYRLKCEVEAYKEQAKHYKDDKLPKFATFISRHYGLNITADEAEKLLRA